MYGLRRLEKIANCLVELAEEHLDFNKGVNWLYLKDFLDLLNYSSVSPESGVEIIFLNKDKKKEYLHKIKYKGYIFIACSERKIYDL